MDLAVDLDGFAGGKDGRAAAGPGQGGGCGLGTGRAGAVAHGQVGEILRSQPGRDRGDAVPVEEEMDTAVVRPDRQRPAGQCLVDADALPAGHEGDLAAGRHPHLELDRGALGWQDGRFDDLDGQLHFGDCLFRMLVIAADGGVGPEEADEGGHVQGLVRALVVVGVHPAVDRFLGRGQRLERHDVIEEFLAQGAVKAFDLARSGG
jgi:hypothetical protein